jgi:uncharacterized protein YbjT (DUF2867 family)
MIRQNRTVLVTGVTGKQGGAVARHLVEKGFAVRGMTRKPDSDAALAMAGLGVHIVQGDLNDLASLERAVEGAWGVFSVQAPAEAGVEGEVKQGIRLAQVARYQGVQRFVYTSVGSADRQTGIPHFESKWTIEQAIRGLDLPSYAILRPVFFMENLLTPWVCQGDNLVLPLAPTTVLQMIAVDDIGRFGALAFERPDKLNRAEIDLAGDAVTMPQVAAVLSEALGRRIVYTRSPMEQVRKSNPQMAMMFEWFERVGYNVDIAGLQSTYGIRPMKLNEWVRTYARVPR